MDLRYTDAEEAFRTELRGWLAETLPGLPPKPSPRDWPGRRAYDTHWQRLLFGAGYAGVDWPVEGGGPVSYTHLSENVWGRYLRARTW